MKIIWIEDEPEKLKYFKYALEHQRHEVIFAATSQEVHELILQGTSPDIVIVDMMLPTGNYDPSEAEFGRSTGLLVLRELKERYPGLRFLIVTNRIDISEDLLDISDVKVVTKINLSPWQFAKSLDESVTN